MQANKFQLFFISERATFLESFLGNVVLMKLNSEKQLN